MKKAVLLLLVMVSLFTLCGCSSSIKDVSRQNMFEQKEDRYFIYFYRDGCSGCEEVKPYILNYWQLVNEGEYSNKRNIYQVNLSSSKNSSIYRIYTGEGGQGTDGKYFVNDVSNWDELYIGSTPSLISIYEKDGVRYARYQAQGKDAIVEALEKQLS